MRTIETCLVVAQQTTQYGSRRKGRASHCFTDISCRNFEYGAGLLPTPIKAHTFSSSSLNHAARNPSSPDAEQRLLVTSPKSVPIPIKTKCYKNGLNFEGLSYSELWAGPAYSNSPPPSSVPIPKFSSKSKPTRTVSLDLPVMPKVVTEIQPLAKSAPSSPRKSYISAEDLFGTADNATKALRRILNLDICDE